MVGGSALDDEGPERKRNRMKSEATTPNCHGPDRGGTAWSWRNRGEKEMKRGMRRKNGSMEVKKEQDREKKDRRDT